jgi:hypothetical protein
MGNEIQSFIVRVWNESEGSDDQGLSFRGSIDHVGSGKRLYFDKLEAMVHFIEARLDVGARHPRTRWQTWIARFRGRQG